MSDELGICDLDTDQPHQRDCECVNWKPLAAPAPKPEASAKGQNIWEYLAHQNEDLARISKELAEKDAEIARLTQELEIAKAALRKAALDGLTITQERDVLDEGRHFAFKQAALAVQERDAAVALSWDQAIEACGQLGLRYGIVFDFSRLKNPPWSATAVALELERVRAAIAEVKLMPHHDECIMMAENCGCYKGRRLAELQRREKELSAKNS
jgi:hypothetical protein